jgi:hypothetical protein
MIFIIPEYLKRKKNLGSLASHHFADLLYMEIKNQD